MSSTTPFYHILCISDWWQIGNVVLAMTGEQLWFYVPAYGDRVATIAWLNIHGGNDTKWVQAPATSLEQTAAENKKNARQWEQHNVQWPVQLIVHVLKPCLLKDKLSWDGYTSVIANTVKSRQPMEQDTCVCRVTVHLQTFCLQLKSYFFLMVGVAEV